MAEIDPRRPGLGHLVEQVISKQLQEVPVPRLRPCWILLKPGEMSHGRGQGSQTGYATPREKVKIVLTPVAR